MTNGILSEIRARIKARTASSTDFVLYNILRGKPADKGFNAKVSTHKQKNGHYPFSAFDRACQSGYVPSLQLAKALVDALSPEQQAQLRQIRVGKVAQYFDTVVNSCVLSSEQLKGIVRHLMRLTPQGSVSVWAHCQDTAKAAGSLVFAKIGANNEIRRARLPAWIPEWFVEDAPVLTTPQVQLLYRYLAMHDCGKPFVYQVDADGRAHFPAHAEKSALIWKQLGGDGLAAWLIEHDMDIHLLKAEGLAEFASNPLSVVQLYAGFASLTANAKDFGGVESTSFKIKLKQLDRRGKALCAFWQRQAECALVSA